METIKKQIENYKTRIARLIEIGQGCFGGYAKDAIRVEVNIYRGFVEVLEDIQRREIKTETEDSLLLDKFEAKTQSESDILLSWDHEDGYFISLVERGINGIVADNEPSKQHLNIRDAIQAAIDYKHQPRRLFR